ncbi:MAG TPA: CHAT domain-containing protein [Phenylobacterium sp.]
MAGPAVAQPESRIADARRLYSDGQAVSARRALADLADGPDAREPVARLHALGALLDICIASYADDCVMAYADRYVDAAKPPPGADPMLQAERAQSASYYFDASRLALGRPEVTAAILDWAPWQTENPYDVELYLRRQILGARVALAQGKPALAIGFLDTSLALVGSLDTVGTDRLAVAQHLAQAISLLAELGQRERAHGLLMATGGFIGDTLPARSIDNAVFTVSAASLLADVGDLEGAARVLAIAVGTLEAIELDEPTRDWLLGTALRLQAVIAAPRGGLATARRAIDAHPMARLYARPGRTPETREEVGYLAARAFTAAVERTPDPIALAALTATPDSMDADPAARREIAVLRAFGRLMLMAPGPERNRVLADFARQTRDEAVGSTPAAPGGWYRPSPIDSAIIGLALSGADASGKDGGDTAFSLFQLGSRSGPSFDADALTALSQAKTAADRESVHRALRLRARRDRVERTLIQAVVLRSEGQAAQSSHASHDAASRQAFLDLAGGIEAAAQAATRGGVALSGANVVPLKRFQSVLAPDEAALSVALTAGGLEYMCVRRDTAVRSRRATDLNRLILDARLLRAGLTATHAPSEDADTQFPAAAAVRLYDDLIRPFEACLRPGDRILWLSPVADFALPLAALLPAAPPRLGEGWDLGQADWLVKRHAISYAGSASLVLATRTHPAVAEGTLDFLGVGDPILTGATAEGEARSKAVLRGVRGDQIAELAPLPDTRDELEISARGFRAPVLLLQADATERRVRGELAKGYRYMSFATHGLIRNDLQGLSEPALVLTPISTTDPADDGLLTASEIADFSLNARFVALSACNTANFDLAQMSRELPALASAFAVAGVPATLGTLWPVNSETGKAIVSDTFTRLQSASGAAPASALAAAQRAFLAAPPSRAYLHPRFWAPFIVLGDGAT